MNATTIKKLLRLTTVCLLLTAMLAGCWSSKEPEETLGNTPAESESTDLSTSEPTAEATEATEAPVETEPQVTSVMATVNTDLLNVRTGPSTDTAVAGQLSRNARIEILDQTTVDGVAWGRTEVGWICLDFVILDTTTETPSDPDVETPDATEPDSSTSTTTGTKGTITAESLNIREGAGTEYESVGGYAKGEVVTILETKDGWGRTDKGWISLKYVDLEGNVSNNTSTDNDDNKNSNESLVSDGSSKVLGYGVVKNGLNIRYGPNKEYGVIDTIRGGSRVAYYEKSNGWIRIADGWISLNYIYLEGETGEGACSGTITASSLNVRQGPGTDFDSLGKLTEGDSVTILAQITVDGTAWGYTGTGWISMKYVKVN